jgi:hypothetical protein
LDRTKHSTSCICKSLSCRGQERALTSHEQLLVLFESSCHPEQASYRTSSAIALLDSLIQALGLLIVDVHEPTVSIFPADEIPVASNNNPALTISPAQIIFPSPNPGADTGLGFEDSAAQVTTCACSWTTPDVSDFPEASTYDNPDRFNTNTEDLLNTNPSNDFERHRTTHQRIIHQRITHQGLYKTRPSFDAGWDLSSQKLLDESERQDWPDNDEAEIQKEECRRLCWSSMLLITVLREYTPNLDSSTFDLHITKQENVCGHSLEPIEATHISISFH